MLQESGAAGDQYELPAGGSRDAAAPRIVFVATVDGGAIDIKRRRKSVIENADGERKQCQAEPEASWIAGYSGEASTRYECCGGILITDPTHCAQQSASASCARWTCKTSMYDKEGTSSRAKVRPSFRNDGDLLHGNWFPPCHT